jgi:dynein heavy chain
MSVELEDMYNQFILRRVPKNWTFYGYLSLKPLGSWFDDLLQRVAFMNEWVEKGTLPSYWVSCFYFPQGFMTAVLQTYARKTKTPIDELVFQTIVRKEAPAKIFSIPEDGVNIHGMILEGCNWNSERNTLVESEKKQLFVEVPTIW